MNKLAGISILVLAGVGLVGTAWATTFKVMGSGCVQNFTTASEIKYDASNFGTAVNSSTSRRNHYCGGGTANLDKTLQSITVKVIDRSTAEGVECRALNGSFAVGPVASAGSDASFKSLVLNITDSQWLETSVRCDIPPFAGGLGSGVSIIDYVTN